MHTQSARAVFSQLLPASAREAEETMSGWASVRQAETVGPQTDGWEATDGSSRVATATLRRKNTAAGTTLPDFKLCQQALVIQTVTYWPQNRQVDQWHRTESP